MNTSELLIRAERLIGYKAAFRKFGKPAALAFALIQLFSGFLLVSCKEGVKSEGFSDTSVGFNGIQSLTLQTDGTWRLEWEAIPELTLNYEIFAREGDSGVENSGVYEPAKSSNAQETSKFDFSKPIARTTEGQYITDVLLLKRNTCYVVRVKHSQYVDTNTKEICTGTPNVSSSITKVTSAPQLKSLKFANGAIDGFLNANEVAENLVVVVIDAIGYDEDQYAIVPEFSICDASHFYTSDVPLAGVVGEIDGSSNKICVKLINAFGVAVYGSSDPIVVDKTAPTLPALRLSNLGFGGKLTAASLAANLPVVSYTPEVGETASYAVANNAAQCTSSLAYSPEIPLASHAAFITGSSRVVCVQVNDVSGNVSYGSSAVITTDTQPPMPAFLTSAVLEDKIVNAAENLATGFAVGIKADPAGSYRITCTINCKIVSGGILAAGGASASGNFNPSGLATVNVKVSAAGTFSFNVVVTDTFGNESTPTLVNGTASLSGPSAPALSMPALSDNFVSIADNASPMTVALTGLANASYSILCTSNCQVKSGATGTLNSSGQASPTIQVYADGAFSVSVTITDAAGNSNSGSLSGVADLTRPTVNIGPPSQNMINPTASVTYSVTVVGATNINLLPAQVTKTLSGHASFNCTVGVSGGTTATPVVTLNPCTNFNGTIKISLAAGFATDAAGNSSLAVGPSSMVTVSTAEPAFGPGGVSLASGVAADFKINLAEYNSDSNLVLIDASSYEIAQYAVIPSASLCNAATYTSTIPKSKAAEIVDGTTKKVCVKLINNIGAVKLGESSHIDIDLNPPAAPVVSLANGAVGGKLNAAEVVANQNVVSVAAVGSDTLGFAIANSSVDCNATLTYSSTVPKASRFGYFDGLDKFVCVRRSDAAGNISYGSSTAIGTDIQAPLLTIGAPVPLVSVISNSDTLNYSIGISDNVLTGLNVSLTAAKVTANPGAGVNCSIGIQDGSTRTPPPKVILSSCTGNGTFSFSLESLIVTDAAGNTSGAVGPSAVINVSNIAPTLSSFTLANGAVDGKLSATERSDNLPVVAFTGSGFDTVTYYVTTHTTGTCSPTFPYAAGVPLAGAAVFSDGSSKKICVRLVNSLGTAVYGLSSQIDVDSSPPAAPSVLLEGPATDSKINAQEATADLATVSVILGSGESASYAIASTSAQCTSALSYTSSVPGAGHVGFAHGTSKVVCVRLSDAAGNFSYGASSSISVDKEVPLEPVVTVNALADTGFVNNAENPTGGFAVVIRGEPNAQFTITPTSNCTITTAGAGNSPYSSALNGSGTFTVNLRATASATFTFTVFLRDSTLNQSSTVTITGMADLVAPGITISAPTLTDSNSSGDIDATETVTYTLSFADTGGSNLSTVNIANSDVVFSGQSSGCTAVVSGSGTTSRTVQVSGCAAGSGAVGISIGAGKVLDGAGNPSAATATSATFSVSNPLPTLSITSPAVNTQTASGLTLAGACQKDLLLVFANADLDPSVQTLTCPNSGSYSKSLSFASAAPDGSKTISVKTQDALGRVSSVERTFVKDANPPVVIISAPSATQVKSSSSAVTYAVSFSDVNGVSSVDSSKIALAPSGPTCSSSVVSGTGSVADPFIVSISSCTGTGTVGLLVNSAAATDPYAHNSVATNSGISVGVDNTAPSVVISSPAASATFTTNPVSMTLFGTCETDLTVTLGGDVVAGQTTLCTSGNYSFTSWTLSAGNGSKTVSVSQTDAIGNTGTSATRSYNLNIAVPTAPTLTSAPVSGLKYNLTGTCDANAKSHSATTTLGAVRSVTCSSGVLNVLVHLPAGGASSFNVTVTSTNAGGSSNSGAVTFNRAAFNCPSGYVGVPGSGVVGLGNSSASKNNSASNSNTNWWLDVDRDFCVMKYPAKNNGSNVATSISTGTPWVSIQRGTDETTANSAFKACKDAGAAYRLISNTQWQTVARNAERVAANWSGNAVGSGVLARGHSDGTPNNALANDVDGSPYSGTSNASTDPVGSGWEQRRTQTLSNGEVVWDFGGNVWQWTSDNYGDLGLDPAIDASWNQFSYTSKFPTASPTINRLLFAPLGRYDSDQNMGKMYGGSNGAVGRGGAWDGSANAGLFTAYLSASVSDLNVNTGFRCVFLP